MTEVAAAKLQFEVSGAEVSEIRTSFKLAHRSNTARTALPSYGMHHSLLSAALRSVHRRRLVVHCRNSSYERKTPIEHVLLRPGMYVGQVESVATEMWLYDSELGRMVKRPTTYSPALLKLFDEILVNAADNKQRDSRMTSIDVVVTKQFSGISVAIENNGKGLPIELHPTEKIYIPELVFGHLLTGSNFNDNENRLTGGSHGYGAKLTNIFSRSFKVEAQDGITGLRYTQEWKNNMSVVSAPKVHKTTSKKSSTKITFAPDLNKFGGFDDAAAREALVNQAIELFQRRALDVAACVAPVDVRFTVVDEAGATTLPQTAYNIPSIKSFKEYVQLFEPSAGMDELSSLDGAIVPSSDALEQSAAESFEGAAPGSASTAVESTASDTRRSMVYCNVGPRWEVAVGESSTGAFENMSFVNSVWTVRGGTHVGLVTAQVVKALETALKKKGVTVPSSVIKNKLMVFVNCKVENPSFDGQTKGALNTKPSAFGSTCKLPDKYLREIVTRTGIVDSVLDEVAAKAQGRSLRGGKSGRRQLIDVPKLEDAVAAGGDRSLECTLILTEGDSAKALAVSGLEVVGRELYGVMPLRGKVLNVRGATAGQVHSNKEFINLCRALGLDFKNKYEQGLEGQGLRYGKVMIMCDQDTDGSHIKGLVINMLQCFWPALLRQEGFLQQFITPLVKARAKTGSEEAHAFFSIPEYKQWQQGRGQNADGTAVSDDKYTVKYYKGLGTSTAAEGREYFTALARHRKSFEPLSNDDTEAIEMAFGKERAAHRRDWLAQTHDPQAFLDPYVDTVSVRDFINKELIHFSYADNHRSIPSAIDGLKPSQRKVLYGCFKKKLVKDEIKVAQLAGYIAEHTAYHHDEASLSATIINMAQDFVGSNNVPLLEAAGQFGTRAQGGKDYASPRYVFTKLSPITRKLFPEEDDGLLQYEQEDGQPVEPRYFLPVVPTLLLNGSQGIGTGWSTTVPTYRLSDVVEHVRSHIRGVAPSAPLHPYVEGFAGDIQPVLEENLGPVPVKYTTTGIIARTGPTAVLITELPYGAWTADYKEILLKMVERGEIRRFQEKHTSEAVRFEITASAKDLDALEEKRGGLATAFRLTSTILLTNMHAFDRNGKIRKFGSPEEVVADHFDVRRAAYQTRKDALERKHAAEEMRSRNRSRFIASILAGDIELLGRQKNSSESDLVNELRRQGFADEAQIAHVLSGAASTQPVTGTAGGFGYLVDLPIHSLTREKAQQLQARAQEATQRLEAERRRSADDLWLSDLDSVSTEWARTVAKKSKHT
jgi:DNA topoisomerase-2